MLIAGLNAIVCKYPEPLEWHWFGLWHSIGLVGKGVVLLLAIMLLQAMTTALDRQRRYALARKQTHNFLRHVAAAIREGDFEQVIALASSNPRSNVANVIAAGMKGFASASTHLSDSEALEAAERSMCRARRMVHADLKLGLNTLATIAANAPFLGLLGTVVGILNAFGGGSTQKSTLIAFIMRNLSEALVTAAMGLLVAVPVLWCRNYFNGRMETFNSEMSNAASELVEHLRAHPHWRATINQDGEPRMELFEWTRGQERSWEAPYDRQRLILLAFFLSASFVVYQLGNAFYWAWVWQTRNSERWAAEQARDRQLWERYPEQIAISPDGRFRAVIPALDRQKKSEPRQDGRQSWTCYSTWGITLHSGYIQWHPGELAVYPNDGNVQWRKDCATESPTLSHYRILHTANCNLLRAAWRSNEELLVQCYDCAAGDIESRNMIAGGRRITIIDSEGRPIQMPHRSATGKDCVVQ